MAILSPNKNLPIGTSILWIKNNPIPPGWISTDAYIGIRNIDYDEIIAIQKVDNLTWIEHLAKQKHLV